MKRKIIKLLSLIFIVLLVFIIYTFCKSNKINYVALEETIPSYSDYIYDYLQDKDLIRTYHKYVSIKNIDERIRINNSIKKDLRESDLVTLFINDNNIENKLKEIRKYAKNALIIIGYKDSITIKKLCRKYKCKYIKLNENTNINLIIEKILCETELVKNNKCLQIKIK